MRSFTQRELLFFQQISKQCTKIKELDISMLHYNNLQQLVSNGVSKGVYNKDLDSFFDQVVRC